MTVVIFGTLLFVLPFSIFGELEFGTAVLIAFALSFSSTVFAVKVFEEQGQSSALHAQTAIGHSYHAGCDRRNFPGRIVGQASFALGSGARRADSRAPLTEVAHGTLRSRRTPPASRHRDGHRRLRAFRCPRAKGRPGALVFGMLVADHSKAKEMAKSLLSFKTSFSWGFSQYRPARNPNNYGSWNRALTHGVGRNQGWSFLCRVGSLQPAGANGDHDIPGSGNYSEFGLIVGALGVSMGWLSEQWLLIIAVAVAGTSLWRHQ